MGGRAAINQSIRDGERLGFTSTVELADYGLRDPAAAQDGRCDGDALADVGEDASSQGFGLCCCSGWWIFCWEVCAC